MGRTQGKKVKDVNKPKRSTSAYFYYLAHCREVANKTGKNISRIAEFTKESSAKWREMNEVQKKPFDEQAAKDKERYDREMTAYRGKKVDPNKPKRPMTAYFMFLGDFRIKMKNRGVDHKEILRLGTSFVRLAGEEWRNMNAEDKKPFEKRSIEAGRRYETEMAEYRKKEGKQQQAAQQAAVQAAKQQAEEEDDDEEEEEDEEEDDDDDE